MVEHVPEPHEREGAHVLPPPLPLQLPDRLELLELLLRH